MINLELTVDEAQQILNALVKEPYGEVFKIVDKIQDQANEQLKHNVR